MQNYYATLGVTPLASSIEVRAAFKRLALLLHPDRQLSNAPLSIVGAQCRTKPHSASSPPWPFTFAEVNEAYEVLSDDMKRMLYDADRQDMFVPPQGATDTPITRMDKEPNFTHLPEEWFRFGHETTTRASTPLMPYMSASTLLSVDRRQLPEEQHTKWQEVFEERRGVIGRRPQSRLSSGAGGKRPPLPASEGGVGSTKLSPSTGVDSSVGGRATTPQLQAASRPTTSSRLEMLRRARPSSGVGSVGPMLTDMHLRQDQLYQPNEAVTVPVPVPVPGGLSRPPLHHTQTPLPSSSASPAVAQSRPPLATNNSTTEASFSLPQFRPASCTPLSSSTAPSPTGSRKSPSTTQSLPAGGRAHPQRGQTKGMSAARRELLGIGHGAAERAQSSMDTLRTNASDRTMRLFFR